MSMKVVRVPVGIPAAARLYEHWLDVRIQARRFTERQNELRDRLKDSIKAHGQADEKGSLWLELPNGKQLKAQRTEKSVLDGDRAMDLLQEKGVWDDCHQVVVTVTLRGVDPQAAQAAIQKRTGFTQDQLVEIQTELVVDEDGLLALASDYGNRVLTEAELKSLYDTDVNWSFIPPDK